MSTTEDDLKLLRAISAGTNRATDPKELATLIHDYYGDLERADRTPRSVLYLHLGLLAGTILRIAQ